MKIKRISKFDKNIKINGKLKRVCSMCRKAKDFSAYNKNRHAGDGTGLHYQCKTCLYVRYKHYMATKPKFRKKFNERAKKYLIEKKQYMLDIKKNKCEMCHLEHDQLENERVFEFVRKNPRIHKKQPSGAISIPKKQMERRLKSYYLLCANCNRLAQQHTPGFSYHKKVPLKLLKLRND